MLHNGDRHWLESFPAPLKIQSRRFFFGQKSAAFLFLRGSGIFIFQTDVRFHKFIYLKMCTICEKNISKSRLISKIKISSQCLNKKGLETIQCPKKNWYALSNPCLTPLF